MVGRHDDRIAAVSALMESFGGSLDSLYWDVESAAAYAIADLPDAISATAAVTALAKTGAFIGVEVHELLTQRQLSDVLVLAGEASRVYKAPGYAAVSTMTDGDSSDYDS